MKWMGMAVLALACGFTAPAWSGVKTSVKTESYSISGQNGEALLKSMNRRGPKHGFLARAMAQTSYTVNWTTQWAKGGGACRLERADARLAITYRYPQVSNSLPPKMKSRWTRFMAGVKVHEEMHGKLAREMVTAAQKAVLGVSTRNDPNCKKAEAAAGKRIGKVYATYIARQKVFDLKEHREGGNVDRLITALVR